MPNDGGQRHFPEGMMVAIPKMLEGRKPRVNGTPAPSLAHYDDGRGPPDEAR